MCHLAGTWYAGKSVHPGVTFDAESIGDSYLAIKWSENHRKKFEILKCAIQYHGTCEFLTWQKPSKLMYLDVLQPTPLFIFRSAHATWLKSGGVPQIWVTLYRFGSLPGQCRKRSDLFAIPCLVCVTSFSLISIHLPELWTIEQKFEPQCAIMCHEHWSMIFENYSIRLLSGV